MPFAYVCIHTYEGGAGVRGSHPHLSGWHGSHPHLSIRRIRQHTSAYVSMHQHSIRQHTSLSCIPPAPQHTSAYFSMRQHSIRQHASLPASADAPLRSHPHPPLLHICIYIVHTHSLSHTHTHRRSLLLAVLMAHVHSALLNAMTLSMTGHTLSPPPPLSLSPSLPPSFTLSLSLSPSLALSHSTSLPLSQSLSFAPSALLRAVTLSAMTLSAERRVLDALSRAEGAMS
jgi:hypothetical protein